MQIKASILAFILAALLALPGGLAASPLPGQAEFEQGMQLYRTRDCALAVEPLESAARSSPRPGALLALGFCYRQLKQFARATNAYQRYLQLRVDDQKHALSLLEQTMEEEREWRRTHPEPPQSVAAMGAPPGKPGVTESPAAKDTVSAIAAVTSKPPVPAAAVDPGPVKKEEKSAIGWPIWVGAGVAVVGAGVLAAVLLSKSGGTEPSATFNGR